MRKFIAKSGMLGVVVMACLAMPLPTVAQPAASPLFSITLDDAQDAIKAALMAEGAADSLHAEIISTRQPLLYQYKQPLEVQVKTLKFDEADHTWSANLLFSHAGEVVSAMPVSGRYEETRQIPVLTQRLTHGEAISAEHITVKEFPVSRIRQNVVSEPEALIGKTPRRTISVSRPIRADEVQSPEIIQKGSVLKMTYQTPYMEISAVGEALEDGTEGQTIRVRNRDSHVTVYGTVISAEEVRVTRPVRDRSVARR